MTFEMSMIMPRFQFLAAVDMPRKQREMGHWYTAVPPICREGNNMGPVDFFGRKMIERIVKHEEQGGVCWRFNVDILPNLPKTLPNSYIISAKDCESTGDQFHFSTEGMRTLGYRYAEQMLKLHKYKMKK